MAEIQEIDRSKFDQREDDSHYLYRAKQGLTREVVEAIAQQKGEPQWMLDKRLKAYEIFKSKPMPTWGVDLSDLNIDEITFYARPGDVKTRSWDEVPEDMKRTFDRLGIPQAEREMLAGVGAQYESEIVYQNMKEEWEKQGVVFTDVDTAVQEHPELVKKYFMSRCVPPQDNKFAALHGAVWSGGSFLYVPEGVKLEIPVQAYFRMNSQGMGQFEHTLIIAEKNSQVHYIEGCSAPTYSSHALHSGCVEVFVGEGARVRYSTVQNWSKNTYNLNTKRAIVQKNGTMEWISGSLGSKMTMLYPCSYLVGEGARAEHLAIAFAGEGQWLDNGSKVFHAAPRTSSRVVMKSISKGGGHATYRGLLRVTRGARGSRSRSVCDALMLDPESRADTFPTHEINEEQVDIGHEATVGKVGQEQLFYLMSRGLSEEDAMSLIVSGFIEPVTKELPLEYAVEMNRLIELEMEDSIG